MYYVPDGTEMCGYYECKECGNRFLALQTGPQLVCPYCGEEPDMEVGPDEEMPVAAESAKLIHTQEWRIKWDRFILSAMDRQFGMWKIRSAVQRILHSRNLDINRRLRQGKRS